MSDQTDECPICQETVTTTEGGKFECENGCGLSNYVDCMSCGEELVELPGGLCEECRSGFVDAADQIDLGQLVRLNMQAQHAGCPNTLPAEWLAEEAAKGGKEYTLHPKVEEGRPAFACTVEPGGHVLDILDHSYESFANGPTPDVRYATPSELGLTAPTDDPVMVVRDRTSNPRKPTYYVPALKASVDLPKDKFRGFAGQV